MGSKISLWIAGVVVIAAVGAHAIHKNKAASDVVVESAMRHDAQPPPPTASPAPAVQQGAEAPPVYAESLPEPADSGAKAARLAALKPDSAPIPAPQNDPAEEVALARMKSGGDCAAGSRPLGDCNCFDEAGGKVTLSLHPTEACLDLESKRLGHKVILSSVEGKFELAGQDPGAVPEATAGPERVAQELESAGQSGKAGTRDRLDARESRRARATRNEGKVAMGQCPAGSKNEGCRCRVSVRLERSNGKPGVMQTWFVAPANPPEYCSNPDIRAALEKPTYEYFAVWFRYLNSVRNGK